MKERLKNDLEKAFCRAAQTQKNRDLKEEILANLYDKYDACLASGMSEEEAYRATVGSIGDLSELFEQASEEPSVPLYDEKQTVKRTYFARLGLPCAIMLYILSLIPVIVWDNSRWATCAMFLCAAVATGLILLSTGLKPCSVPASLGEAEKKALKKKRNARAWLLSLSVTLYILCLCPVILTDGSKIGSVGMFCMAALATALIVLRATCLPLSVPLTHVPNQNFSSPNAESEQKAKKPRNLFLSILSALYWLGTAALYFLYSFWSGRWMISWLIFLCAALLYAVIHGIWQLIVGRRRGGAIVKIVLCSVLLFAVISPKWLLDDFEIPSIHIPLYDDQGYAVGDAEEIATDGIFNLDIEWIDGNVIVRYWDESYISVTESSSSSLSESQKMRTLVSDGTLHVKYAASRTVRFGNFPTKTLTVQLPAAWQGQEISISSVSGNVELSRIFVKEAELSSVSGDLLLTSCTFERADLETVSGKIEVSPLQTPSDIDLESVSGNATVHFNHDVSGAEIRFDSLSGDLQLEPECTVYDHQCIFGDRACKIDFSSVSGGLTVTVQEPPTTETNPKS